MAAALARLTHPGRRAPVDSEWSARGADKPTQGDARGLGQSALALLLIQAVVVVLLQWVVDDVLVAAAAALIVANLIVARLVSRGLRGIVERRLKDTSELGRPRVGAEEAHRPGGGEPKGRFSELGTLPLTIATTANVQAYESVPTRRGGAPVTFDNRNVTLHSGSPETSRTVAVADYEESVGYGYASVMSIVAMSGAAVSPMMGRFAATFGPFRLLLALFNIWVGVWVPHPRYAPPEEMTGQAVSWREGARQWPTRGSPGGRVRLRSSRRPSVSAPSTTSGST